MIRMTILGISALYHDSAACIVKNGEIIAAAQEERFTRIKHDLSFPYHAIACCLSELEKKEGDVEASSIDAVVYYDQPLLTLDRYMKNILAAGTDSKDVIERGFDSLFCKKLWIREETERFLQDKEGKRKFYVCDHHMSHAASAFYPSPFDRAVILTLDGVGEWATTTIGTGCGKEIKLLEEMRFPHSAGSFYSAFTYFCGFKVNSGDYKFMGLAPYGEAVYEEKIREHIIDIKDDGSFRLNLEYFDFQYGRTMTNKKFEQLFDGPERKPESEITKREMDIAASVQNITEDIILRMAAHAKKTYGKDIDNLVMAGGVALNCVANGKIKNSGIFKNLWIQPAAGDAGGSLGAALYASYQLDADLKRRTDSRDMQKGSFLGNSYEPVEIKDYLNQRGYPFQQLETEKLYQTIAEELAAGKVIGLFQGRMEFGPRALGGRSIIADARLETMQVKLNQKIKYRESFRPFAPSVLLEDVSDYFEMDDESPYMLIVENVRKERQTVDTLRQDLEKSGYNMLEVVKQKRSDIPAVTHVDYSARIQTVTTDRNDYYYQVIRRFKELTGCGVIVNTSFNVRGEPVVCTPKDACECFMRTDMDLLVLENCILYKEQQPQWEETVDWKKRFTLD